MMRIALAFVAILGLLLGSGVAHSSGRPVDVALVLAIDVSYSVNSSEFRHQRDGTVQALLDERIQTAIAGGYHGAIALSVVLWSRHDRQEVLIPWTIVDSAPSVIAFADALNRSERVLPPGGTSIAGAIEYGLQTLARCPCQPARLIIDISSDGRDSFDYRLDMWRSMADAAGVTINGLAILNEIPTLDRYFENQVVTGPAAFVEKAESYEDYGEAIERKLLRELTSYSSGVPLRSQENRT